MTTEHPLYVALLWHMHQPYYRDRRTGVCLLPWARLHGLKNYYDIPAIGAEYPGIRQTFNLVPSLIMQLEEYALHDRSDVFLDIARRPAEHLSEDDRLFLIRNFFLANTDTMVNPYPRYRQLLEKRGVYGTSDDITRAVERFTPQDYLDLQMWFHLTWTGHTLRTHPEIQAFFEKGRNFAEEDKQTLFRLQQAFLADIVPYYRRLQDAGQIEVSVSPYYHPILPLLCDTEVARVALPDITLPAVRFSSPDDAKTQVQRSVAFYQERFGRAPRGMWPSEGSVSPAIVPIVAEAGLRWLATDDEILIHSLHAEKRHGAGAGLSPQQRYRPYRVAPVTFLFRDHFLSDRIGFVYSRWDANDAANDFVHRLQEIRHQLPSNEPYVVPVILDGENAWEYYPNHGKDFLDALYTRLSTLPWLRTVTISEAVDLVPAEPLPHLFSGSWIGHSFATWIGHPEKNAGWECLVEARQTLTAYEKDRAANNEARLREAWESLYTAEGSDWFWWYGDDHSSVNDAEFDGLFRSHVGNVYRALDLPVPDRLHRSIRQPHVLKPGRQPLGHLRPVIDGRSTNYYEWLAAGYYDVRGGRGSMHQAETFLKRLYYGFDATHLYLRIDTGTPLTDDACRDFAVQIRFTRPASHLLRIACQNGGAFALTVDGEQNGEVAFAVQPLIELGLPLNVLNAKPHDTVELECTVFHGDLELERWPYAGAVQFKVPDPAEDDVWMV